MTPNLQFGLALLALTLCNVLTYLLCRRSERNTERLARQLRYQFPPPDPDAVGVDCPDHH